MRAILKNVQEERVGRGTSDCPTLEGTPLDTGHQDGGNSLTDVTDAPVVPEGFRVIDADTANWVVRKVTT